MKEKIHYVIEAVIIIAVIILFVFQFSGSKAPSTVGDKVHSKTELTHENAIKLAFLDIDSLMENYNFAIDLNEQFTKRYENTKASLAERARKLDADIKSFQRKVETNSFLSQERARAEEEAIYKKRDEYVAYENQLSEDINKDQMRMHKELRTSIMENLNVFIKSKGYHLVFGKSNDNILYGDNAYNITAEFIDYINKQYSPSSTTKPAE